MAKSEEASGEPPLDRSTERGSLAPAIRVAPANTVARIVNPLQETARHARSVACALEAGDPLGVGLYADAAGA